MISSGGLNNFSTITREGEGENVPKKKFQILKKFLMKGKTNFLAEEARPLFLMHVILCLERLVLEGGTE